MGLYIDSSIEAFADLILYGNIKEAVGDVCIILKTIEDEKKPRDMTVEEYLKSIEHEEMPRDMTVEEYLKSIEHEEMPRDMTVEEYLKSIEDEKKPGDMTVEEYLKSIEDDEMPRDMTVEEYLKSIEDEKKPGDMTVEEYLKSIEHEEMPRDMTVEEYLKSIEHEEMPRDMTVEEYLKSIEDEEMPRDMTVEEYLKSIEDEEMPRDMTVEEYLKSIEDEKKPRDITIEEYLKSIEDEKKPCDMTVEEYLKSIEDEEMPRDMTVEEYLKSIEDEEMPRYMTVEEYLKSIEDEEMPRDMTVEEYLKSIEDEKKPRDITIEEYLKSIEDEKKPCDMTVEEYLRSMEDEKKPRDMTVEEYLRSMEDEKKPHDMTVEEYLKSMKDEKNSRDMTVEEYLKSMEDEKKPRDMTVEEYLKSMEDEKKPRDITIEEYLKSMEDEEKLHDMTVEEYLKSIEDEKNSRDMTVEEYLRSMEDEEKLHDMTVEEYLKSMEDEKKPRDITIEEYLKSMEDEEKLHDMTVEEYLKSMEDEKNSRDMTVEEYLRSMEDEEKLHDMTVEGYLRSMEDEGKLHDMTVEEYLKSMEDEKNSRDMTVEEYLKSMEDEEKLHDMTVEEYLKSMEDEKNSRDMTVEEYLKSMEDGKSVSPYNNVSVHYFGDQDKLEEFPRLYKIYDDSTGTTIKVLRRLLSVESRNVSLAYNGGNHDESLSDLGAGFLDAEPLSYKLECMTVNEPDCLPQRKENDRSQTKSFEEPTTNEDLQNIVIEDMKLDAVLFEESAPSIFDFEKEREVCGFPQPRPPVNERCKQTLFGDIKPEFEFDDDDFDDLKYLNLEAFASYQAENISNEKILRKPKKFNPKQGFIDPSIGHVNDEFHIPVGGLMLEELKVEDSSLEESFRPDYIPMDPVQNDFEEEQSQYVIDDIKLEGTVFEIPEHFPSPDKDLASSKLKDDVITYNQSTHPTFHHTQMSVNKISSELPEPCVSVQYFDTSLMPRGHKFETAVCDKRDAVRTFSAKFDQQSSNVAVSETWKVLHFCAVSVLFAKIQSVETIDKLPSKKKSENVERKGFAERERRPVNKWKKERDDKYQAQQNRAEPVFNSKRPSKFDSTDRAYSKDRKKSDPELKMRKKSLEQRWQNSIVENKKRDPPKMNQFDVPVSEVIALNDSSKSSAVEKLPMELGELRGNAKVSAFLLSHKKELFDLEKASDATRRQEHPGQPVERGTEKEDEKKGNDKSGAFRRSRSRHSRDVPRVVRKRQKPSPISGHDADVSGTESFTESETGSSFAITGSPFTSPRSSFRGRKWDPVTSRYELPSESEDGSTFAVTGSLKSLDEDSQLSDVGTIGDSDAGSLFAVTGNQNNLDRDSELSESETVIESEDGSTFAVTGNRKRVDSDGSSFVLTGSPKKFKGSSQSSSNVDLSEEDRRDGERSASKSDEESAFAVTGRRSVDSVTSEDDAVDGAKMRRSSGVMIKKEKLATFV